MQTNPEEVAALNIEKQRAYENFANKVSAAKQELDGQLQQANRQLQQIYSVNGELAVLIRRTPGPEVTVYHAATHPCGRVTGRHRDRSSYSESRERDARAQYLARCSACKWYLAERDLVEERAKRVG